MPQIITDNINHNWA